MFRGFSGHLESLKTRVGLWSSLEFSGAGDYTEYLDCLQAFISGSAEDQIQGFLMQSMFPSSLIQFPNPLLGQEDHP